MPSRKKLKTYYTSNFHKEGNIYHGGTIFPPCIDIDKSSKIRCPNDKAKYLKIPTCRILKHTQFGQEQLLYHGTANPDSEYFPSNVNDNLRWYAFEPNMSLDYIKEECETRTKKRLECKPILYVYKVIKPINNIILYADPIDWMKLGGQLVHLKNDICNVKNTYNKEETEKIKRRAHSLGCPLPEYMRAKEIQQYRIIKGDRGERIKGWVRINSFSVINRNTIASKGFECMLSIPKHDHYLELVGVYDVIDATNEFGRVSYHPETTDDFDWHMTSFTPSPTKKRKNRRNTI